MNTQLFTSWSLLALIALLSWTTACVFPGEFDEIDTNCEESEGRFDVSTRNSFCSGRIQTRLIHRFESLDRPEGTRSLVDIQDPYVIWLEKNPSNTSATVRLLRTDNTLSYEEVETVLLDLPNGDATSFAVTGLRRGGDTLEGSTLAVVANTQTLHFVKLDIGDNFVGGPLAAVDILDEDTMEDFAQNQRDLPAADDCSTRNDRVPYRLTDVAAFNSANFPDRRYLMVSAGCALSIFGYDPDVSLYQYNDVPTAPGTPEEDTMRPGEDSEEGVPEPGSFPEDRAQGVPELMLQFPLRARDITIDRQEDRFYMASGTDGLLVRTLSRLEAQLDEQFERLSGNTVESDPSPSANNNNGGNNGSDDSNNGDVNVGGERGAFTPGVEGGDSFVANKDAVRLAATFVDHVSFASNRRVFYINSPRPDLIPDEPDPTTANDPTLATYLVAVVLDANGVVETRTSIPLAKPDPETGELYDFTWKIVGLGDSQVAVLGNRMEGEEVINSSLLLYDAPQGGEVTLIKNLPTNGKIYDISLRQGQLWVTQPDAITGFIIEVDGEPLVR